MDFGPRLSIEEKERHAKDLNVVVTGVVWIQGPYAWCMADASSVGTSNRSADADTLACYPLLKDPKLEQTFMEVRYC